MPWEDRVARLMDTTNKMWVRVVATATQLLQILQKPRNVSALANLTICKIVFNAMQLDVTGYRWVLNQSLKRD